MDLLKEAINKEVKKRKTQYKQAAAQNGDGGSSKKYVRVADLEHVNASTTSTTKLPPKPAAVAKTSKETPEPATTPAADSAVVLAADEVIKRLRARGEPIRLFGETDSARSQRLRALEITEEKHYGQQNEFHRVLAQVEAGAMLDDLKRQAQMNDEDDKRKKKLQILLDYDVSDISVELLRRDIDRLNTLLYVYFKRVLYEWDDFLSMRPDEERLSVDGKMAMATQRQSAEYLKPLFRGLKARTLQADIVARITEIARHMIDREYMKANDAYLQLSIGNAPWPVGVTQVGIHSRASRETINADKVAHVLNNETQRKWIQSIKRLIRFAQTKYPPADLAKLVG
ncbi:hypothetical protein H4R22_001083 [Coemansia sp. RSA 1290]|nr:hypothetical protein H4R22_001083 [Coemansia sp. RSA 1290]KAJ2649676.1 hypothetical protein IWW40_003017 [Coemansia sp. RSA 1250]